MKPLAAAAVACLVLLSGCADEGEGYPRVVQTISCVWPAEGPTLETPEDPNSVSCWDWPGAEHAFTVEEWEQLTTNPETG